MMTWKRLKRHIPLWIAGVAGIFMAYHLYWLAVPATIAAVYYYEQELGPDE